MEQGNVNDCAMGGISRYSKAQIVLLHLPPSICTVGQGSLMPGCRDQWLDPVLLPVKQVLKCRSRCGQTWWGQSSVINIEGV